VACTRPDDRSGARLCRFLSRAGSVSNPLCFRDGELQGQQLERCRVASFHGPRAPAPWANTCVLRVAVGPRHTEQPDIRSWVKGATIAAHVPIPRALPPAHYRFEQGNYWSNDYMTIKNARDPQACAKAL
jgi:hypothetical protein